MAGSTGSGPGTINVTGEYASLYFDNTQTFDNATINLGNATSYYDYLDVADVSGAGNQVLTLGSGVTIDIVGYAQISAGRLFRRRDRQRGRRSTDRPDICTSTAMLSPIRGRSTTRRAAPLSDRDHQLHQ